RITQYLLDITVALLRLSPSVPVPPEGGGEARDATSLPPVAQPAAERLSQIVLLGIQALKPHGALHSVQMGLGLRRKRGVKGAACLCEPMRFLLCQQAARVFADRLEHPEAGLSLAGAGDHERLLLEQGEPLQRVRRLAAAHGASGVQSPSAV